MSVDFLVKLRDAACLIKDACEEQMEKMAPPGAKAASAAVKEETFNILKFEPQEGAKIGVYDVAYKANNLEDKWTQAFNILRQSNATIKTRYHGPDYQFSYWIYGEGKIYKQRLKRA